MTLMTVRQDDNPSWIGARRRPELRALTTLGCFAALLSAPPLLAQETVGLGLDPGAPQITNVAGGITPAYGQASENDQDWRFDFHGMVLLPLRIGLNERKGPVYVDQKQTVLHTPPVVPGSFETFEYTAVAPDPWVQLNFSYGNPIVTATIIVAARTVANADTFFNPPDHIGVNDAFFTYRPRVHEAIHVNVNLGGFASNYGHMGEYDLGRHGTPLIARVSGVGSTGTAVFDLENDLQVVTELGIQGQLTKTPVGIQPAAWNGFADPNVGSTFALHGHAALGYMGKAQLGLHYISAFAQDDRATPTTQRDGGISVFGLDARLTLGRFGHFYLGYGRTDADEARSVSGVVRVLNAAGGAGLADEYFGRDAEGRVNGVLDTIGGQYDFSLGNFLNYPNAFTGKSPDIVGSVFGIYAGTDSPITGYDGIGKLKYGMEVGYSMLSWFALAGRFDRVINNLDDDSQTHAIWTGRAIFRSDFGSQDQLVLQYSNYQSGSGVQVKDGSPPLRDPSIDPDDHVVSLMASMWW
jgi:hypothetical protein